MNTLSSQILPLGNWQQELARGIRSTGELLGVLDISPGELSGIEDINTDFPLRVPHSYAARMIKGDPNDPLLRQVLPLKTEHQDTTGFTHDPVGDLASMTTSGLIRKYQGRVLLIATGACAIHCRYCFRRHFPYSEAHPNTNEWQHAIDYIANDASITEVILSGGDPLTLSDQRLTSLTNRLADITHLKRLRIHTRLPVVLPERVDNGLIAWLNTITFKTVIVIHANHPNEINNDVNNALIKLSDTGITLFNQTVLLRGINNDSATLVKLSEVLFEANVIPYYLHMLDKVLGASHFEVDDSEARRIHKELLSSLPGYLVPRLVREKAGNPFKLPLSL
jgi:EF-P beta-lysylation protein EpmB